MVWFKQFCWHLCVMVWDQRQKRPSQLLCHKSYWYPYKHEPCESLVQDYKWPKNLNNKVFSLTTWAISIIMKPYKKKYWIYMTILRLLVPLNSIWKLWFWGEMAPFRTIGKISTCWIWSKQVWRISFEKRRHWIICEKTKYFCEIEEGYISCIACFNRMSLSTSSHQPEKKNIQQ